jgi:CBS domain-containing protein
MSDWVVEVETMEKNTDRTVEQGSSAQVIVGPGDPVQLLISVPIVWAESHAALADLAVQLGQEHVGALLVMEGDQLAGVISERDLVRAVGSGSDTADVWIADVMALDPVQVDGETAIAIAAETMLDSGVRHLPVTSEGRVIGIVSMRDILRVFTDDWQSRRS